VTPGAAGPGPAGHGPAEPGPAEPGAAAPSPAPCPDGVCITCSDAAVEVRITELRDDDLALADTGSGVEEISVALVDARPGDTVLVHAKEAIAVVRAAP
jgi:hydrogenase maturation factor